MCTVNETRGDAMVCDVALPTVLAVLASEPGCVVEDESIPGEGTRLHLISGDSLAFVRRVRAAIAEVNK